MRFITAWKEDGEFALTHSPTFDCQADAEGHAHDLVKENTGATVVVLQVVAVRQSRVVVVNNEAV